MSGLQPNLTLADGTIKVMDVDLTETMKRIDNNTPNATLKDGATYKNDTHPKIKNKKGVTYTEWTVPTPGVHGRGNQRIVVGSDGSRWYTPNHYGQTKGKNGKPLGNTWRRLQ